MMASLSGRWSSAAAATGPGSAAQRGGDERAHIQCRAVGHHGLVGLEGQIGHDGDEQDDHGVGPDRDAEDGGGQQDGPEHALFTEELDGRLGNADGGSRLFKDFTEDASEHDDDGDALQRVRHALVDDAFNLVPRGSDGYGQNDGCDQNTGDGVDLPF